MKKSNRSKLLSGFTGAAMLMSAQTAAVAEVEQNMSVSECEAVEYAQVSNISGEFTFDQDVVTPADEVFNLFGTAATALCAKPGFAYEEPQTADYYININGDLKKTMTVSIGALKEAGEKTSIMKCSCGMGSAIANAQVVGIPLKNVVQMVELDDAVNTVTVKDSEGYGLPIPLSIALENEVMLVYQIGDRQLTASQGAPLQLWMPKATARYFTRKVSEIEFTHEDTLPEMKAADAAQRAKISVLNHAGETFNVGDQITFEGYADDFDQPITAVEFSMDNGTTWTTCSTEGATADKWVYWYFGYVTEAPGTYKLDVRAVAADGTVSPLASSVVFTVE